SDAELIELRREMRAHPSHGMADREANVRWVERYQRLRAENSKLERKMAATQHSLVRSFDHIRELLTERGYLDTTTDDAALTEHGTRLARIYSESDLLLAECIRHDAWDGLRPSELAAVASTLVFEARRETPGEPRLPEGPIVTARHATLRIWTDLTEDERRHQLGRTREPDAGFAWPIHRWARGESLHQVLTSAAAHGQELSAGDFVRWARQVIDLLDQLRDVLGTSDPLGDAAAQAVRWIRRGVVAAGET